MRRAVGLILLLLAGCANKAETDSAPASFTNALSACASYEYMFTEAGEPVDRSREEMMTLLAEAIDDADKAAAENPTWEPLPVAFRDLQEVMENGGEADAAVAASQEQCERIADTIRIRYPELVGNRNH